MKDDLKYLITKHEIIIDQLRMLLLERAEAHGTSEKYLIKSIKRLTNEVWKLTKLL